MVLSQLLDSGALSVILYSHYLLIIGWMKRVVDTTVKEPYMDELFHVPQARILLSGNLTYYNPAITTPPGLYLITLPILWPLSLINGKNLQELCSLSNLRLVNAVALVALPVVCSCAVASTDKLIRSVNSGPKASRRSVHSQNVLTTVRVLSNPVTFCTSFLYYTDTWSLLLTLTSFHFFVKGVLNKSRVWRLASLLSLVAAILVRQTNIVWAAFFLLVNTLNLLIHRVPNETSIGTIASYLIANPLKTVTDITSASFEWIILLLAFACVLFKGQLVLGHAEHHQPVVHVPQLFYCAIFISLMRLPDFAFDFMTSGKKRSRLVLTLTALATLSVHYLTHEHIFLISDNRHVSFYVWRRFFRARPAWARYSYAPLYAVAASYVISSLKASAGNAITFAYLLAAAACLVPHKLLEFRYFIVPHAFHAILSCRYEPPIALKWKFALAFGGVVLNSLIGAFLMWMFIARPLYDNEYNQAQRLMW